MSTCTRFPARRLPPRLQQVFLAISPPAALAGEVLPHLVHCPSTCPALVVVSVAEPFQLNSGWWLPRHQSVEPSGQQLHACHQDRSLCACLALETVAEVLAAPVGLPLRLGC